MPPKREHLRASRILLGTQTPVVHELLELAVRRQGMVSSPVTRKSGDCYPILWYSVIQ